MSLQAGARVGLYAIVALIGSGGMGEVYRARDPLAGNQDIYRMRVAGGQPECVGAWDLALGI